MSDLTSIPVPKDESSFANLLASFTGASKRTSATWDDSALLDDVSTISYAQALRSHRRVPPVATLPEDRFQSEAIPAPQQNLPVAPDKKKKSASITIRLTEAEQTQLRQRAADADLSISAYLRSCIFEAESLRAQVKEALSHIRAAAQGESSQQHKSRPASSWRARLLPHWRGPASG